jgi:beta-N-acetylhexosaminidase
MRLKQNALEVVLLSALEGDAAPLAVIFGLSGTTLTTAEKKFFAESNPLGFILFARNCETPAQVRALTNSLRDCMGRDAPILIDQEGGRVQRLKPPHWTQYPPAKSFGESFVFDFVRGREGAEQCAAAIAKDLTEVGVSVNCAPVMDVLTDATHDVIGDRAFSADPQIVAALGAAVCKAYLDHGIIPIVKHIPGHGRAVSDSHKTLPKVEATLDDMNQTDFLPYAHLLTKPFSESVWGMVAHVVYTAIDPQAPSSCSRRVVHDIIRRQVGFDGLLLTDDIDMGALELYGDAGSRAEKALRAGCDIALQCSGKMNDMESVAARITPMTAEAVIRYNRSVTWLGRNKIAA